MAYLTYIEEAHGHYLIRFSAPGEYEVFSQCLAEFKSIIPRDDRFYIKERRAWMIRGNDDNIAKLAGMFPNFYKILAESKQLDFFQKNISIPNYLE